MGKCYFCEEQERVSYFNYYCKDCAMLRRWLLTYSPEKCCNILKRTLTRDDKQIDYKINQEIKKIVLSELPTINEKVEEEVEESNLKSKLRPRKSK
tara:strand:+ start:127 stop:414 length:288 start_codon:yes stop_codon:yes gene_type:complete